MQFNPFQSNESCYSDRHWRGGRYLQDIHFISFAVVKCSHCSFCLTHSRFAISSAKFILILSSVTLFMTWCHDPFRFCLQYSLVRMLSLTLSLYLFADRFFSPFSHTPIYMYVYIDLFAHFLATYVVSILVDTLYFLSFKIFIKKNATETEINHLELIFFHRKFVTRSFFQRIYVYCVIPGNINTRDRIIIHISSWCKRSRSRSGRSLCCCFRCCLFQWLADFN